MKTNEQRMGNLERVEGAQWRSIIFPTAEEGKKKKGKEKAIHSCEAVKKGASGRLRVRTERKCPRSRRHRLRTDEEEKGKKKRKGLDLQGRHKGLTTGKSSPDLRRGNKRKEFTTATSTENPARGNFASAGGEEETRRAYTC